MDTPVTEIDLLDAAERAIQEGDLARARALTDQVLEASPQDPAAKAMRLEIDELPPLVDHEFVPEAPRPKSPAMSAPPAPTRSEILADRPTSGFAQFVLFVLFTSLGIAIMAGAVLVARSTGESALASRSLLAGGIGGSLGGLLIYAGFSWLWRS